MARSRQALIGELGRAMQAYQRSTQAFDDEVGRVLGLNPADLRCLDWLTEGPLSASRLAEATGLSAAATTAMIDRLERKGFVQRPKHETDRRQVLVELTDAGQARTWAIYGRLARRRPASVRPLRQGRPPGHAREPDRDARDHRQRARPPAHARCRQWRRRRAAMTTLLDLLDRAVTRYGDRPALGVRHDDGTTDALDVPRARPARADRGAGGCARSDLEPGDRILTWSPSTPGAAGRLLRRDARPARPRAARPAHVRRRGRDDRPGIGRAPPDPGHRPRRARSRARPASPTSRRRPSTTSPPSRPTTTPPSRPTGRRARRPGQRPTRRRGLRAHLHERHDRHAQGRDAHPRQRRRLDRVVPPDRPADGPPDRLAAAAVAPARAGGRAVLRARCRRRHPVRPQPEPAGHLRLAARAPGDHDGRRAAGARPVLERHRARGRQARPARRRSSGCAGSPDTCPSRCGALPVPQRPRPARRRTSGCSSRPARSCRRRSSRPGRTSAWRPAGLRRDRDRHRDVHDPRRPRPRHGRAGAPDGIEMRIADGGEIQFRGRTVFSRLLEGARADRRRRSPRTAGIGPATSATSTTDGRLVLSGRIKDIIVLPNGFNVYPEDIENALRDRRAARGGRRRDGARPHRGDRAGQRSATSRPTAFKVARSTRRSRRPTRASARTSASPAGGPGPSEDFPRTHTLKVKRDPVRHWAAGDAPLPVARA